MAARAECEDRVDFEDQRVGIRGFVPARHDPDVLADVDRLELRLREAHPVGVRDGARRECRRLLQADGGRSLGHDRGLVGILVRQRDDAAVVPGGFLRHHARFAEQGLFVFRAFVRVFHRDRQRARFHQGVGKPLGVLACDLDYDFSPTH